MNRPHRIRRQLTSPAAQYIAGAVALAIAVAVVLIATDTTASLPTYLEQRPAASVSAFWAVVALGLLTAFSAAMLAVLSRLERDGNR